MTTTAPPPDADALPSGRRADLVFVACLLAFTVTEAIVLPLARDGDDRLLAVALSALMALVFLPRRRRPVAVALAATALYVTRIGLHAAPVDTYAYQVILLAIFFGAAAYGERRWLLTRLLVVAAATVVARLVLVLEVRPVPMWDAMGRAQWVYVAALAATGAAVGWQVRDRRDDVGRLRSRVEELEAALPRSENDAAGAEQRRVAEEVRKLVTALAGRVELLLDDAQRTLSVNAGHAREVIARTGDNARETLTTMRDLLDRLRSDEGDAPAARVRPGAVSVDDLAEALELGGARVHVDVDPRLSVPGVLVLAADRVAAIADDVLGGPPERAVLRVAPSGLHLDLRGPHRRRRAPAPSPARLALAERVRLLGGALRLRPRRGRLSLWLPLEAEPTGRSATARPAAGDRAPALRRAAVLDGAVTSLLALGLLDVVLQPSDLPPLERLTLVVLLPLPLLLRHRRPLEAMLGLQLLLVLGSAHGTYGGLGSQAWIAALASAYFVGTSRLGARAAVAAGACAVLAPQLAMSLEPTRWTLQSYVSYGGMLVAAWVVGRTIRVRLAAAVDARRQLARLDERRRAIEERAVAAERARLARELHDVVGHSILVICIQTGAAERLAEQDESAARDAIASARTAAATAMRELDRLSRLMPAARGADGPGLADLPALVEDLRTTGVDVELRLIVAQPVPPALGATVYRIVQEALTNVAKHAAGASATVAIEARDDRLLVRVSNAAGEAIPQDSGGHGLRNMRERAAEHHGALIAGADADGGWAVTAAFPLRSAHDAATFVG